MTCEHFRITASVFDDGSQASLWWCVACKLKFEPIKILKPMTHEQRLDMHAAFEAHKSKWNAQSILIDMVEKFHGIKEMK